MKVMSRGTALLIAVAAVLAVAALLAASAAEGRSPQGLLASLSPGGIGTKYTYPPACCSGTFCSGPPEMRPLQTYCCGWGPIMAGSQRAIPCYYNCGGPGCCNPCGTAKCVEVCPMQGTAQPA